jgi:formate C-acetyltransferase
LSLGISGLIDKIKHYSVVHMKDEKRSDFLEAAAISMNGFRTMVGHYADAAAQSSGNDAAAMEKTCRALTNRAPRSFREALQLVWLIHLSFCCEGRFAMALGRIDQYLRPFYEKDIREGIIDREEAVDLLASTFIKIGERALYSGDDVVNICIGGVLRDGSGGVNDLSFDVLEAVRRCNIPGPNLSARLYAGVPGEFLDACLQVIGTGLGYPALMNDEVNIPALARHSYSLEDSRDYCFVGCIENFIPGRQPPWSDGRFNVPKYVELALNNGRCMLTGVQQGLETGAPETLNSMAAFMTAVEKQIAYGFELYMADFTNYNNKFNRELYRTPYLSCYCRDCIERGLDINGGGALYPSIHGAGCMGIGTVADSLAAVERVVYEEKQLSLADLRDVLKANFEGYEALRARLLNAPKYGNDDDFVDKYAVWYVKYLDEVFSRHHTPDGGPVYTAIASNTSNIPAGLEIAATPDGRKSGEPLSDAASPMHGMDRKGPTAVINSMSKPDYKLVSCGTVLNQKYGPEMFRDPEKRKKLAAMIKVYFDKGGQEIQINSVSRDVLKDAMDNPEKHAGMVVRVSGFSAYYTKLPRSVQEDILKRTEHS